MKPYVQQQKDDGGVRHSEVATRWTATAVTDRKPSLISFAALPLNRITNLRGSVMSVPERPLGRPHDTRVVVHPLSISQGGDGTVVPTAVGLGADAVSPRALSVYLALSHRGGLLRPIRPTLAELAEDLGVSSRTISNGIAELSVSGWLVGTYETGYQLRSERAA